MEFFNDTPFVVDFTMGLDPQGEAQMTVIVKGTFSLPDENGGIPTVAEEQLPLLRVDELYDGPTSSVRLEMDTLPLKSRSDIVLVGAAHAPGEKAVKQLDVTLRVGEVSRSLRIFGDREWLFPTRAMMAPLMSEPEPFVRMPLTYERAFGGMDFEASDWCRENHLGVGFIGGKSRKSVHRRRLPNLEDPDALIRSWRSRPRPVGFGFYNRGADPRGDFAGTYDEEWQAERSPVLPEDFDVAFYNGAHPDLQYPGYLRGDEEVELVNLREEGDVRFNLPGTAPAVSIVRYLEPPESMEELERIALAETEDDLPPMEKVPVSTYLDTLVFLTEEGMFYQVWRGQYRLDDFESGFLSVYAIETKLVDIE